MAKISDRLSSKGSELTGLKVVAIASVAVASLLLGVRHLGGLQRLELTAYDLLVQKSASLGQDPRLLIVTVTDTDIKNLKKWPISDSLLAEILEKLQKYQPKVIGLDLYRDIPIEPGHKQLVAQLQKPNVISIRNIDTLNGPAAPPEVSPEQVGFNDIVIDPDGVFRRNVLFADSDDGLLYSFGLRLALTYLQSQGISPESSKNNPRNLQLGSAEFIPLKENSGGYQTIDAQGYQILLKYRSGRNVAQEISFSEVLSGAIAPDLVKDKIVLIGTTANSLKDNFYTPYSPTEKQNFKMPGVLIHAQLVSQFLDAAYGTRPLFWFWPEWVEVLWIIGWIIAGGWLAWCVRHPLVLIVSFGFGLGVVFLTTFYGFSLQVWIPMSAPILGFILAIGVVISYRSYESQQQQQMVMKLLGQNTSPEVAKALWQGRDHLLKAGKLPGIRLTATMMFTDLKDFSTVSEQREPEELLEWLNELLDVITHEVLSREGIINKFTGDGVMAGFGVPMSRVHKEDVQKDAQRAVDCALVMSDRLEFLNQNWASRGLPVIKMRVGLFTGPVVVGSLGGKDRLEYGIIGDSVNIASRLESCEKHRQPNDCRILIGYETWIHVQDLFEVEHWGPLPLKGKQQMVDVYLVLGRKKNLRF